MVNEEKKKHVYVGGDATVPAWVVVLYNTLFFGSCSSHGNGKRNKVDRFCIDCAKPLCSLCFLHRNHDTHNHVKIRRFIYSDVINKQDLTNVFNCHGIQTYQTNKAKVIFLKKRSQQQVQVQACNFRKEHRCIICDKTLRDNLYCSIACKVADMYRNEENTERGGVSDCYGGSSSVWKKTRRQGRRKGFPLRAPMF